jgi:SAM-dependent methyltransferase
MIDFPRYLGAKKTVDDRALNRVVWERLKGVLSALELDRPLRILELGCGIGTMAERLLEWGLAESVEYLGIDSLAENIQVAQKRFPAWAVQKGYQASNSEEGHVLKRGSVKWRVEFQVADFWSFQPLEGSFDLLIANAFLDLLDVSEALPRVASLLSSQGLFYFTINFDGVTVFEPVFEDDLDTKIMDLYHGTMDTRLVDGKASGDSRTGRHLFAKLRSAGAQILEVGSSDWVVYPTSQGYSDDEAYFLHCILAFIEDSLKDHPDLEREILLNWLAERRAQIDRVELTYIAHQLDFLGKYDQDC